MPASSSTLGLFQAAGVEIEYMIVHQDTLDVLPVADQVFLAQTGRITSDVDSDSIAWSNELMLHVLELKTANPASSFTGLADSFQAHVARINHLLEPLGGQLMPSAMHPWMNPHTQSKLWPHDNNIVYETFHRIFNCRGHGWANLQSTHLNLPFADTDQFARLHAAIRLILPILPALAASSPFVEGKSTSHLDNRLLAYRDNCKKIPSLTAAVIPEPVFTPDTYQSQILDRIYQDLKPLDPAGTLRYEWSNARGAIARFDRDAIEIRLLDAQECPQADIAVAAAVTAVLRLLVAEQWSTLQDQQSWPTQPLADILTSTIRAADQAPIKNPAYLRALGWAAAPNKSSPTAGDLWQHLIASVDRFDPAALDSHRHALRVILQHGPLARRLLQAAGPAPTAAKLHHVYSHLCRCLAHGDLFLSC
ncbi:MAG: hypothetical protein IT443_09460 [Phycisphaeraceae bacterium]|nr:hypothetical protein [Phycisphaeraceae bacterium]